jgi:hypothetical protein
LNPERQLYWHNAQTLQKLESNVRGLAHRKYLLETGAPILSHWKILVVDMEGLLPHQLISIRKLEFGKAQYHSI